MTAYTEPRFQAPVVIVGAPRSGTSLLHRILRGHPGFVSTARESQPVWQPLTEPAQYAWTGERAPSNLQNRDIDWIHRRLAKLALPAEVWQRADARDVPAGQRNPWLSRWVLRPGYRGLVMVRGLRWRSTMGLRLVDKCVHSGLWPELLESAFPDARYLHIVRDPADTLHSMVNGWLSPERFFTWELPRPLAIPDYPFTMWNFPLPQGWEAMLDRPLAEVVAFQWDAIQKGILGLEARIPSTRFLRVHLEDFDTRPRETVKRIASFLDLPWSDYMETFAISVPRVNASSKTSSRLELAKSIEDVLPSVGVTANRLGYV
ncbi:sulfotransferase family protein [Arhodomonas sp. AD133]|uniref:sulfotransferase family protein n=1 Tax=Arhodomonas sp. AD133 TaxID=3415009 RepID=UPI003EB90C1A